MAIIVYLCLLGSLPPTATKMYESFILHTICRHLKRVGNTPNDTSVTQIEKLPQPVCEVLQQLKKVAFDGLVKDKIVFTIEVLPVLYKDDPTCYGLLQSTECFSAEEIGTPTQSFNFLHLGIQEYFAAKYVTTLPEEEVYTLLKESFIAIHSFIFSGRNTDSKSVRLSNMWILYYGITSGQCKILRHYLIVYGKQRPLFQQKSSSDQRIFNTETISQDILKDPVKVFYLFQCFQEAQDNVLCEILSKSFDDGVININGHSLLPHEVVSLGFFLSRSYRKWKELNLHKCHIGDHGMSILHQYLCGDKANKQEITKIDHSQNDLTGASSHLIADIISYLQLPTLVLNTKNITSVRNISTAVITTSTVKVLYIECNDLIAQEAGAIYDLMIFLEVLNISNNKLGNHGAELLSEGITNIKPLRVLNICNNNIGPSRMITIVNTLSNNTSLEALYMYDNNFIGQDTAKVLSSAIINHKKLKILSLCDKDKPYLTDKESAMIIIRSLYNNNIITKLCLDIRLCKTNINLVTGEVEMVNSLRSEHIIDFTLYFIDQLGENYATYTTQAKLAWVS